MLRHGHAAHGVILDGSPASLQWMKQAATDVGPAPRFWLGSKAAPARAGLKPVSGRDEIVAALGL